MQALLFLHILRLIRRYCARNKAELRKLENCPGSAASAGTQEKRTNQGINNNLLSESRFGRQPLDLNLAMVQVLRRVGGGGGRELF